MNRVNLLLLDGNSVINRAYFALAGRRPLTAPDGTPTGALLGFLNIYLKTMEELSSTHVCAVFDRKEPTFRHQAYDGYKATRKPMPDDLALQMPLIKEILHAMGIRTAELPGYEADDLIGTLSARMGGEGVQVSILSGDRDGLQLVNDHVRLMLPVSRSGQTTTEVFDRAAVLEKYGVDPERLIDVKAIMGDASDNIPGVRGIGEKGALALIAEYGTLDAVYESLDSIRPALASKLTESKDIAYLSRELATICKDAPIDLTTEDLRLGTPDREKLGALLSRLGMRSIAVRLGVDDVPSEPSEALVVPAASERMELTSKGLAAFLDRGVNSGAALVFVDPEVVCAVRPDGSEASVGRFELQMLPAFVSYCVKKEIRIIGFDLKNDLKKGEAPWHGARLHDILIAAYLLSQLDGKPDFARIHEASTGSRLPDMQHAVDAAGAQTGLFDPGDKEPSSPTYPDGEEAARLAVAYLETAAAQHTLLSERGMTSLAEQIEMPLVPVLAGMEKAGFHVDRDTLTQLSAEFQDQIESLEQKIHALCGGPFNINSPKQLSEVLFDKLGLPGGKRNANGNYSTDAEELERLSVLHPGVMMILEYRTLSKLRSTFVEGLAKVIDPVDGRVHTNFNQAVTATGRLSSSDPNLQNIPVRSEIGREIRKAFVAPPGFLLLDADYSQIELRLLAHLSGDQAMIEAFLSGKDIHTATACKIFSVEEDAVDAGMRSIAKTVNFSIAYGVSGFGLARSLGIGVAEAQRYIDEYYAEFPGIRTYLEGQVALAYRTGYAETLFGRRRPIPELRSSNRNIRNFGERVAMNTPVQGTAADIMKMAMVRVEQQLRTQGLEARLVLQVHDELIVEASPDEADRAAGILCEGMEAIVQLQVPLEAEVRRGASWFDTK